MFELKPYLEYKESGQQWIGSIPVDWDVLPNRALFKERIDRGHDDEQMLSVTIKRGVILQTELLENSSKKDSSNENKSNYKLEMPGDIAYNKMRAWQGAVGASAFKGIVSPAYIVQTLRGNDNPEYFHYLLRTPAFATEAERWSYGITSDQWSLRSGEFKQIYCLRPSQSEQNAIVDFLNRLESRFNRLIRAKRRVIELLNNQKQAIIHRTVTRGLDSSVRLKPSGIEWLGSVPEHWIMDRAKYLMYEIDERSMTGQEELLSVSHITGISPRSQKNVTMFMASSYVGHKLCRPGDLVVNTMWAWMGALGVSPLAGIVSPSYAVYRLRNPGAFNPKYLDCLLRTRAYTSEFVCRSTGIRSSRLRLYPDQLFRIPILQPPRDEQDRIVDAFVAETAKLEVSIQKAKQEIEFIREFHTRLIADIVTGKLDVRGVVLPELESEKTLDMSDGDDEEAEDSEELVAAGEDTNAD
jgi:type I restriction enzyme S subunit